MLKGRVHQWSLAGLVLLGVMFSQPVVPQPAFQREGLMIGTPADNSQTDDGSTVDGSTDDGPADNSQTDDGSTVDGPLRCLYYELDAFIQAVSMAPDGGNGDTTATTQGDTTTTTQGDTTTTTQGDTLKTLAGLVVPHHLVATPMIEEAFRALDNRVGPEVVILLGPNHRRVGQLPLQTGAWDWELPQELRHALGRQNEAQSFSLLHGDEKMVAALKAELPLEENFDLLEQEHAISGLIPFVALHFPEARVVPLPIHGNMGKADCETLAQTLSRLVNGRRACVIASIDFSHHLSWEEAYERDALTQLAITKKDYGLIMTLDNTYLDAPPTLVCFLKTMTALGLNQETLLGHSHAGAFLKRPLGETTSYFTFLFSAPDA